MANRPRKVGTAAESIVVNYLQDNGWPYAERRSLHGSLDRGDITGTPGVVWEVKVGHAVSGMPLAAWMTQTAVECRNAKAAFGVLVVKPRGFGPKSIERWLAMMSEPEFAHLMQLAAPMTVRRVDVRNQNAILPTLYPPSEPDDPFVVAVQRPLSKPPYIGMPLELMVDLLREVGFGEPIDSLR